MLPRPASARAFAAISLTLATTLQAQTALRPLSGEPDESFGFCIASVPDLTGDSMPDVLIGVPYQKVGEDWEAGRVYVFGGNAGHRVDVLESPFQDLFGNFGQSVAGLSDVDGDGSGDIVVGAPGEGPGRVHVFSGRDGSFIRLIYPPSSEYIARFGTAVAGLPDVDGDGRGDFVASNVYLRAWNGGHSRPHVWIFSGRTGAVLRELVSPASQGDSGFGESLAGLKDVDGDGRPDVVVGAKSHDGSAGERSGKVYVYSGATGRLLHTLDSPSARATGEFGAVVAEAGDLNNDGLSEIIVSAPGEGPGQPPDVPGRVHIFGPRGRLLTTLKPPTDRRRGGFGASIAGIPDIDGDGTPDLAVGAPGERTRYAAGGGRMHLYSGATFQGLRIITSPSRRRSESFGAAVVGLGKQSGTAPHEVRVFVSDGLCYEDPQGQSGVGAAYLFRY
ncbi:MAG: FG-GAP repeat protein [Phycisphaerales bacterium]|nr:FG-GAP repeat protein [Phycisphaerales bacterium]